MDLSLVSEPFKLGEGSPSYHRVMGDAMAKIMVVDDETNIVYIMGRFLERMGHIVLGATDGRTCLERLDLEKPDLVMLDIMMPGLNGWEVCKRIKDNPATESILVAMFSVLSDPMDKEKSLKHYGADEHFSKTNDFGEVAHRVHKMLVNKDIEDN